MEYREAVAEITRLDQVIDEAESAAEGARWTQARLVYEQVEAGVAKNQLARDCQKDKKHIYVLDLAWRRFGRDEHRPRWGDAYERIQHPDWVSDDDDTPVGVQQYQARARTAVRNMPPEQKAEVVREALAEPEVAEQVIRDTQTRTNLARAEHGVDQQQQQTARERYELAEPRSVQIGAVADAEYAATKARQAFEDLAEAVDVLAAHDWPDNSKERVTILTQRALAAGELVRAKVEGRTLDEELAALLEGGDA